MALGFGEGERERREREARERETTGYEPFAIHAPAQNPRVSAHVQTLPDNRLRERGSEREARERH